MSVRQSAQLAGVHYPHSTEVLAGRRKLSGTMLIKLEGTVN
jgi:plasmid maintenance system antidote protein VapI